MQDSNLRFGHVTEYDPSRHMARVNFPDLGITSYWLPVLVPNSLKNREKKFYKICRNMLLTEIKNLGEKIFYGFI